MGLPEMEKKTAAWLESEALRRCRGSMLLRHLTRVKIEPTKPPGTGPNWQVAGFEPELKEGSPAHREAMKVFTQA